MYYCLFFFIDSATPYIFFFFFNDTATTEIYTLSLHDALPILRTAIGVQHEDGALGSVQTDRFVDLLEDKGAVELRSEEHTSELRHLVISYAVFCLKKKKNKNYKTHHCVRYTR